MLLVMWVLIALLGWMALAVGGDADERSRNE